MAESLNYSCPPTRKMMFDKVISNNEEFIERLKNVERVEREIYAAWKIFNFIYSWYQRFKVHGIGLHDKNIGVRTFLLRLAEKKSRPKVIKEK